MLVETVETVETGSQDLVSPAAGTKRSRLAAAEEELATVEELADMEELAAVETLAAVEGVAAVEDLAPVGEQTAVVVPSLEEASGVAGRACTVQVAGWPRA